MKRTKNWMQGENRTFWYYTWAVGYLLKVKTWCSNTTKFSKVKFPELFFVTGKTDLPYDIKCYLKYLWIGEEYFSLFRTYLSGCSECLYNEYLNIDYWSISHLCAALDPLFPSTLYMCNSILHVEVSYVL